MSFWILVFLVPLAIGFAANYEDWFSEEEREAGPLYCIIAFVITLVALPGVLFLITGIAQLVFFTNDPGVHSGWTIVYGLLWAGAAGAARYWLLPRLWGMGHGI